MATLPPLDARLFPWLAAVALATLAPHAEYLPPWLAGLSGLVIAGALWRWHRGRGALHRVPLVALVLAGIAGVLAEYRTIFGQEPGVALLALFMALKLLELRTLRDGVVVVMLGYFLLLTHYFYSETMLVGAWMLLALVLVTTTLVRMQTPGAGMEPPLRLAAVLVLQSLPLMVILFFLFPRISGPLWGLPQDNRKATTGLSDQMTPGSISELSQSASIAFRVQFAGATPDRNTLYWRGPVMTDYDGRTWRVDRSAGVATSPPSIRAISPALAYSVTLEAHQQRWLLALDMPVEAPDGATFNAALSLFRREPVRERFRYDAASAVVHFVNASERPEVLRQARALPSNINPRARELASGWRDDGGEPEAIAGRALAMFREQNFVYTLQPPLLGQNAIDDFLFGARRGFCEHYAAAFVFLMRSAGIPARVVAGYQGGEFNPIDGYMVVRQSDAHAWAEIWVPGKGWVRVDPTAAIAPSRVELGIAAALPATEPLPGIVRGSVDWVRTLRFRWEALNNAWNQWVIGYDALRQRNFLSRFGIGADWKQLVGALGVAAGLTLLLIAGWVLHRRPPQDPAVRSWQRFCRRMDRLGVPPEPWEGPLDYARRVAQLAPEFAASADRAATAFARLRYGRPEALDLGELQAATRSLPRRLRRQPARPRPPVPVA